MAPVGGLSAQFGMVDEVTHGVPLTPSRFLEFNNETVEQTIERISSSGLRPNRRVARALQWVAGRVGVGGDIEFDVQTAGFGLLLKHMLGTITSVQPNLGSFPTVWEHTAKVGPLDGKSFTAQITAGDSSGTVRAFTYAGCKVAKWDLDCGVDGIVTLKVSIDAASESTVTAVATATYAATAIPLVFTGATFSVGGTATDIQKASLSGDNGLKQDRYFMRATTPASKKEQLEANLRTYSGTLDTEFMDLTLYNRFVNGTQGALTMFFNGPIIAGTYAAGLEITLPNVRFDGKGPDVSGDDVIPISLPFVALDDGTATTAVQAVYRTVDTAP